MSFVDDNLSESALKEKKREEEERRLQSRLSEIEKAVKYTSIRAAEAGRKSISGYFGYEIFNDDDYYSEDPKIIPDIGQEFDDYEHHYSKSMFGTNQAYVDLLCKRVAELILKLGFTKFCVKPIETMIMKRVQYETFFHGTQYKEIPDHQEFVVFIQLEWD